MACYRHCQILPRAFRRAKHLALPTRTLSSVASEASVPNYNWLAGLAFGAAAAGLAQQKSSLFLSAEESCADVELAERVSSAFVFIKPHAVTDNVKLLVANRFTAEGMR